MAFLLKCYEASFISSEKLDRRLTLVEWGSWYLHITMCPACRLFEKQIKLLRRISHTNRDLDLDWNIRETEEEGFKKKYLLSEATRKNLKAILAVKK